MKTHVTRYYSTNQRSSKTSFSDALLRGIAPDGGLYLPEQWPVLSEKEILGFANKEYKEVAFSVLSKLIGNEIGSDELKRICHEAYNFDIPLENVCDRKYIMRLDQGPTASFKDFAARMMSRLMQYYLSIEGKSITIITATSGDTGSAVASAFYGLPNIRVIILFPIDEVTVMQRRQMTTLQGNITVIGINGKFDDCQKMAKMAFLDQSLSHISLSSANSINIGRLLPQSVYYFYSWSRLSRGINDKAIFSIPSGNFGNLMGGLIAAKMGLPVERFIISTNENDEVPQFLQNGIYSAISPSINCISSAMNVGHPSNLARIIDLYNGSMDEKGIISRAPNIENMRKDLFGVKITDARTKSTINEVFELYKVLLEPHGAVAWQGLTEFLNHEGILNKDNQLCISLETAHPAKFPEELKKILNFNPSLPSSLSKLDADKESYLTFENDYSTLKEFILQNY